MSRRHVLPIHGCYGSPSHGPGCLAFWHRCTGGEPLTVPNHRDPFLGRTAFLPLGVADDLQDGRTTGTTTNPDVLLGTDTDYCYDWPIGNDRVVLCQFRFPEGFTVSGGDRGASVFGIGLQPYGTAYLVGLAVGGGLGHRTIVTPAGSLSWDFGYDVNGGYVQYYTCIGIGFCF